MTKALPQTSRVPRGAISHRLAALTLLVICVIGCSYTPTQATDDTITVVPTVLPLSDPELVNPMRGFHRWYDQEIVPQPQPSLDHYSRYGWRELEPARGQYDFSPIEQAMESAQRSGAKFAFRVMAVNEFTSPLEIPAYLQNEAGGAWCSYRGSPLWVPNWDSPAFLARARALMEALGTHFDGDPRLDYYDIGLYGHWGEWHTDELCSTPASQATKRALVDMQINAFSHSRVIMNSGSSEVDAFIYALAQSPRIGVRVDSLCNPWFDEQFTKFADKLAVMQDRWKTAPMLAEFYGGSLSDIAICDRQVQRWHIAGVANGNWPWAQFSSGQQAALIDVGKHSGYRFVLNEVHFPAVIATNSPFTISAAWSNVGVTPAYEPAVVTFELRRSGQTQVVWSGQSQLNLEQLLPTSEPQTIVDNLWLSARLVPGQYSLSMTVLDPKGYRPPLALAIAGRDATGRYPLGAITVEQGPSAFQSFLPFVQRG